MITEEYIDADDLIARALRHDARQSNRAIARAVGCAHSHVAKIRRQLIAEGRIAALAPHPPKLSAPVTFAEPSPPTLPRWRPLRPHGAPFSTLERAEAGRDALFVAVQGLVVERDELRARLAEITPGGDR